jgi:Fe2+ or Zn2+ uptake regulation protein
MGSETRPAPSLQRSELTRALESHGYRLTRQRAVVFDYLAGVTAHPTAEEVYTAVKQELPSISLATVYKGLESLVASGVAQKLTYGDASARYDARMDDHQHCRCLGCGRVADLEVREGGEPLLSRYLVPPDFSVSRVRVEATGYCSRCV